MEWAMFPYLIHPGDAGHLGGANRYGGEAMSRVGYLVIAGIDTAAALLWRRMLSSLRAAARRYARWNDRRLTVRALSQLDERMLRDVGVDPRSLHLVAAELTALPSRRPSPKAVIQPELVPAPPLLRLDLDCPELKHAA